MQTKQVIVMRKDLNMRKGKIAAQAAHASMAFLTRNMKVENDNFQINFFQLKALKFDIQEIIDWLNNSYTKICVSVDSEEELIDIHAKAWEIGLHSELITDNGKTEFNGAYTRTCLCIGPHESSRIDAITGHLKLL